MHREILTDTQVALLPLLKRVRKQFGLVGGTAIAFHIGHRRSIDFDLFSHTTFRNSDLKRAVGRVARITKTLVNRPGEYTCMTNGVKVTFYQYPYAIPYAKRFADIIRLPDLLTLGAMKAFALGQRAKWKDYVDLYFIMRDFYSVHEISKKAKACFGGEFNEKLFRTQLSYFADVSYEEEVVYLPGHAVSDKEVQRGLRAMSIAD